MEQPCSDGCDILREDDDATFAALRAAREWEERRRRIRQHAKRLGATVHGDGPIDKREP